MNVLYILFIAAELLLSAKLRYTRKGHTSTVGFADNIST